MANNEINVRHKLAYKTFADWYEANPVLLMSELSFVSDLNNIYKIGDGETSWRELPFDNAGGVGTNHFYWNFNEDTESVSLMFRDIIITVDGGGSSITITDALAQDALSLQVSFTPTQDGTPSIDSEPTTEPYLSKVIPRGNKEYYSLVGGTVAWNQLFDYQSVTSETIDGITFTNNNDGTITVNGTANADVYKPVYVSFRSIPDPERYPSWHKYYIFGCPSGGSANSYNMHVRWLHNSKYDTGFGTIWSYSNPGNASGGLQIFVKSGTVIETPIVFKPKCIDLTLMFANEPAIADYAYSLEQSEAGSGIAWLKSYGFFTEDYYPYNAGELISVNTSGKKIVGFNQWDERCEVGSLNTSTGAETSSNDRLRTKNYISILPNTAYYTNAAFANRLTICYYDVNKDFISSAVAYNIDTFMTPTNARYMRFYIYPDYGKIYHDDICINISDPAKNGTYKPYVTNTYPIDPTDLRGLFKLDSANKLYCEGDIYPPSGGIERKYGIVDLGMLNWTPNGSSGRQYYGIADIEVAAFTNNLISNADYRCASRDAYDNVDGTMSVSGGKLVWISDSRYSTASDLKTSLSGKYLVVECKDPTTETATPYTSLATVEACGTEEFIDNRTVPIPVGNETYYASEYEIHGKTGITVSHGATEDDPNPTEYEVEFTSRGTVYGGMVDIVSGVLSMTWAILSNPQNLNWISNSSQGMKNFQTASGTVSKKSGSDNWKCSRYSNGFIGTDKTEGIFIFDSGEVCIRDYRYWEHGGTSAEVAAFKASLADVTIAYELATPLTYQLTPQQVQMLLNDNYLTTPDGTIKLTYKAS